MEFNKYKIRPKNTYDKHFLWLCLFCDQVMDKIEHKDYVHKLSDNAKKNIYFCMFNQISFIGEDALNKELINEISITNPLVTLNIVLASEEEKNNASNSLFDKLISTGMHYFDNKASQLYLEITHRLDLFLENFDKMMSRVYKNSNDIAQKFFNKDDIGIIKSIESATQDLHNNGSYTLIIETDAGKFLYKPHNLNNDLWFKNIADRYFNDIIHTPQIISIDSSYGFSKFIKNNPVNDIDKVNQYYHNLGGLLAIIYSFGGYDYHKENIIADDIYPVIVDFETIFNLKFKTYDNFSDSDLSPYKDSIVTTGMMPFYVYKSKTEFSPLIDLSPINISMPLVDNKKITVENYINDFLEGFEATYLKCLNIKNELISLLKNSTDLAIRVIPISTHFYYHILKNSYKIDNLKSFESRKKETKRFYLITQKDKNLFNFAKAQEDQILNGDIPYFYTKGNDNSLYSNGTLIAEDYLIESPLNSSLNRLNKLSLDDLNLQKKFIVETLKYANITDTKTYNYEKIIPGMIDENELNNKLIDIYNQIKSSKIYLPNNKISWIATNKDSNSSTCSYDLFDGFMGYAVFFSSFEKVINDEELKNEACELCLKCLNEVDSLLDLLFNFKNQIFGLSGLGGLVLGLSFIIKNSGFKKANDILDKTINYLKCIDYSNIKDIDLYGGISALIISLYDYYSYSKNNIVIDLICVIANRLLELKTLEYNDLLLWDTMNKNRPISGLGHGIFGVVLALTYAYRLTHKKEYLNAAIDGFNFEHNIFSSELNTWPDLRELSFSKNYMQGICSGAPGIGVAINLIKNERKFFKTYDEDYIRSINACKKLQINRRDHLCCGGCATVYFLINDYKINHNIDSLNQALNIMNNIINRQKKNKYYVFTNVNYRLINLNSFMFGNAGVGFVMAKLLEILNNN